MTHDEQRALEELLRRLELIAQSVGGLLAWIEDVKLINEIESIPGQEAFCDVLHDLGHCHGNALAAEVTVRSCLRNANAALLLDLPEDWSDYTPDRGPH
jgi:hypothetical protein